ncbi:MAG: thioredoxin family protein [Candidatus Dependentiae bacterium]|nr:thioredoxin family protein [Candidatus Dependentiae bacterium]
MDYEKIMKKHWVHLGACLLLCFLLVLCIRISAGDRHVSSDRNFNALISRAELAVVMFYEKDKKLMRHDAECKKLVARLESIFSHVSKVPKYKDARVHFLALNYAHRDLADTADNYAITQMPTYMLFEDGLPIKKGDKPVQLVGDVSYETLRDFIDEYVGDRIEEIREDRAEARRLEAERWQYSGWGWGWGGYYPYYYWNYPYYGYYGNYWW